MLQMLYMYGILIIFSYRIIPDQNIKPGTDRRRTKSTERRSSSVTFKITIASPRAGRHIVRVKTGLSGEQGLCAKVSGTTPGARCWPGTWDFISVCAGYIGLTD